MSDAGSESTGECVSTTSVPAEPVPRPSLRGHIAILRIDHWFKNVFVLPGIVVALSADRSALNADLPLRLLLGLVSICLIASSNYVLNEVLDAPYDRKHPTKWKRPVPSGRVSIPWAYAQWLALMVAGLGLGLKVSALFFWVLLALWVMGCVYNIPPIRSKDHPYVDVLSEAVNNPLRMLAGWYLTGIVLIPPASLLISYWMIGCYFMALKRFAELRNIDDAARAQAYRGVFRHYTEERLLVSVVFYGAHAMLFFGAFVIRYHLELILSFPLVALVMAIYMKLAFKKESPVQHPEGLYRERALMLAVSLCAALMTLLFFMDIPLLHRIFSPTMPLSD